jgi:RimJ/RimL family protein N-acetyltransferase
MDVVHMMVLEPEHMHVPTIDSSFELRFLTPDDVRRFARDPVNGLSTELADRAQRGLDHCFGALQGDRLANYGWYAVDSVEGEHCAGAGLGLPPNIAYMYKGFTHPDFRGMRLHGASMGEALRAMSDWGIERLLSVVYWDNAASLRSCDVLGYERLGLLVVGPRGPIRVPRRARRFGVAFGRQAFAALESRQRTVLQSAVA